MSRYITLLFVFTILTAQEQVITGEGLDTLANDIAVDTETLSEGGTDTLAVIEEPAIEALADTTEAIDEETALEETALDTTESPELESAEIPDSSLVTDPETLVEVVEKPAIILAEMPEVTDSTKGLEFGYKGYPWGTPNKTMWPRLKYMGKPQFTSDSSMIVISGKLEDVNAKVYYAFSDSGFWKVEIDYDISDLSVEDQVEMFTTVEKNLAENYGKIRSTSRNLSGPHANRSGFPVVKFKRAYYHSSWSPTPCKIELVLFSLNQTAPTDLNIIEQGTGFLKLVYYNPDFMIMGTDEPAPEKLPTIFELY